jgi:hypothetical protein
MIESWDGKSKKKEAIPEASFLP